jgi:putative hydrolase of the HAD superfamily
VTLRCGAREVEAVLFDLDDVLVPFHTTTMWQWAWHPQGPLLGERRVHAAVRRSLKAWDRRRWQGLTGKLAPADVAALRQHLADTLAAVAGHSLPAEESEAVVRRMLHPAGQVERYADVPGLLDRLRAGAIRVGVVTPLPLESAKWLLHRGGFPESMLLATGDPPGPSVPDRAAFRAAAEKLGTSPARTAFVGDLFWSDVRAAARADLAALLLDRYEAWPKVQAGRLTSLDAFEATLAAGDAPSESADTGDP